MSEMGCFTDSINMTRGFLRYWKPPRNLSFRWFDMATASSIRDQNRSASRVSKWRSYPCARHLAHAGELRESAGHPRGVGFAYCPHPEGIVYVKSSMPERRFVMSNDEVIRDFRVAPIIRRAAQLSVLLSMFVAS